MDPFLNEGRRKRQTRSRGGKALGAVFAAAFCLFIGGLIYAIFYSPIFQVKNISIVEISDSRSNDFLNDGNASIFSRVLTEDSKTILKTGLRDFFRKSSWISSLFGEKFLFFWPKGKVSDRFLRENVPHAKNLSVEKNYLEREIRIIILKRQPIGVWCAMRNTSSVLESQEAQDKCFWFDADGFLIEDAPLTHGNLIVNVEDYSRRDLSGGVLDSRLFDNFLKILEILNAEQISARAFVFSNPFLQEIETNSEIFLLPQFRFSLRNDPGFISAAIRQLQKIGLQKIKYVDLRVENRAYYQLK